MTDTPARATAAADDQAAAPDATQAQEQSREQIAELVAKLTEESNDLKDRLLRTLAEMENLRRRTEREVADARTYGVTGLARELLAVADNLQRALQIADAQMRASADATTKSLIEGVELTERELLKVLEKNGVKKFEPQGEKFDPNLHQAMFELPDPSRPSGTVAQWSRPATPSATGCCARRWSASPRAAPRRPPPRRPGPATPVRASRVTAQARAAAERRLFQATGMPARRGRTRPNDSLHGRQRSRERAALPPKCFRAKRPRDEGRQTKVWRLAGFDSPKRGSGVSAG